MIDAVFSALCGVGSNVSFRKRNWPADSRKREDTRRARARSSFEQWPRTFLISSSGRVESKSGMAPGS